MSRRARPLLHAGTAGWFSALACLAEPALAQPAVLEPAVSEPEMTEPEMSEPPPDDSVDATVTVTVTRRPQAEVSKTSLTVSEIEKLPGVAGDPLAVVQSFAGVARSEFGSGQIIVRGAAPEDTRVFVDGMEIPLIYHFGGLRSVIPMQLLAGIDFYPGNFSPSYGRATGGVVNARLARLAPPALTGSVDVSLLDASVYLAAPIGDRAAIAVAGRRSYIGDVLGALLPSDTLSFNVAPRYYDAQLLASYAPNAEHDLRLFLLASDDRLELVFDNPADFDPNVDGDTLDSSERFYRALVSHTFSPSDTFSNTSSLAYGYAHEDDRFGQLAVNVETHRLDLRDTARHELAPGQALTYGLDASLVAYDVFVSVPRLPKEGQPEEFDLTELVSSRDRATRLSPALFAELALEPWPGLSVFPGVRADWFGATSQLAVQPRLNARVALSDSVAAKAGIGAFAQEPSDDELNPDVGNPRLGIERALHASAGAEYRPWPWLALDTTLFYRHMSDLVSPTDAVRLDAAGAARAQLYDNAGRGRAYGAEIVLRHERAHGFSGWLAYTLSRSTRDDSGATETRLFDYDQTHILTALGTYELPAGFQVGARFRLVSGNPLTPVVGAVFDADADRYRARYGAPNSQRNPPFHQLDVRVDKGWQFDAWRLNAYLEVQNAYNRANPEGLSYNYDYRQSKRESGLPLLPVFGVRADF
jgi:outer membrane receptor for ferrienterochelin and colicin